MPKETKADRVDRAKRIFNEFVETGRRGSCPTKTEGSEFLVSPSNVSVFRAMVYGASIEEHYQFLKGLLLSQQHFGWNPGGSVSLGKWIFRELHARNAYAHCNKFWAWCESRGILYYIYAQGFRDYKEYAYKHSPAYEQECQEQLAYENENRKQKLARKLAFENMSQEERDQYAETFNVSQRSRQKAVSVSRANVLSQYGTLSITERFELLINDRSKTVDYFPSEWADLSDSQLTSLPQELVEQLIERTAAKCSKPWKTLRARLRANGQ